MPRKSAKEKPLCYIHDNVRDLEVETIRQNVCVNDLPLTKYADEKYYCLFHLPTKDKDIPKFEEIFKIRLDSIKKQSAETENLPDDIPEKAIKKSLYDFRYVWFPSYVNTSKHQTFEVKADFSSAMFSCGASFASTEFLAVANFGSAIFIGNVYFRNTTFSDLVSFGSAIFKAEAVFRSATFTGHTIFSLTIFDGRATFNSARFLAYLDFNLATFTHTPSFSDAIFNAETYFNSVIFLLGVNFITSIFSETSQIFFRDTEFCETINFQQAVFAGYIAFESINKGKMFLDTVDVIKVINKLKERLEKVRQEVLQRNVQIQFHIKYEEEQKAILNLQNIRLEKPERISFYRVRLCPNWFVNTDSRKLVFTDINWDNVKNNYNNENVKAEFKSLIARGIQNPKQLFKIACRQLAENAETNNVYEIASYFRQMAMETEWFEKKEEIKNFFNRFKNKSVKSLDFIQKVRDLTIHGIYRFSSSYGESWGRAIVILIVILFGFALIYTQTEFQICPNNQPLAMSITECKTEPENCKCRNGGLNIKEAITHSISTALFQNVEYRKPLTAWSELATYLEKILAPLQAALLALAIRRKFMR